MTPDGPVVRPLAEGDLDVADHIMRVAFGTFLGASDPSAFFGDAEIVRTRYHAAPEHAWAAELDGRVVGSVFAVRWGRFGWFGPLTTHPDVWNRGIGGRLLEPVLEALDGWRVAQAGLFTFPESVKHVGLYQRHGFWPRLLTALLAKPVDGGQSEYTTFSSVPLEERAAVLEEVRRVTDGVFPGLDVTVEILSCASQRIGDTVLMRRGGRIAGFAVCHCGAGSEAGSGDCFVKFGAVPGGPGGGDRFDELLDACEAFAAATGLSRLTAGVNTGRRDAYRRLLSHGFRTTRLGLSMHLRPDGPNYDGPERYVLDDLR